MAGKCLAGRFQLDHVISAGQFNRSSLEAVMQKSAEMETNAGWYCKNKPLDGLVMATLFYEPSTRTRLSFESAMSRLGGKVIGTENAKEFSSAAKGETIEDTIRVVNGYADVIVMRHYEMGASARAASVSRAPIINAGDGPGEHPTQALLDLYTIQKEFGSPDQLNIAMVGDLKNGRTVRSLSQLLSHYSPRNIVFVAPEFLSMGKDIKELLREKRIPFVEVESLEEALMLTDVVYMTRIQKERFSDQATYEKYKDVYVLDAQKMRLLPEKGIVMHPLPRVGEIAKEVDLDPRARYFEQAQNGLYVRMALLDLLLRPE